MTIIIDVGFPYERAASPNYGRQKDVPHAQETEDLKDVSGFRRPSDSVQVPRDVTALR
jgi:hypothetical protein